MGAALPAITNGKSGKFNHIPKTNAARSFAPNQGDDPNAVHRNGYQANLMCPCVDDLLWDGCARMSIGVQGLTNR